MRVDCVDFETAGIDLRPAYPPVPVGVSIKLAGKAPRYYAWGHPTGNNCTKAEAKLALQQVWDEGRPVVFHNGKFDLDVAEVHMGMPLLPWERYHDTMFLSFLRSPHETALGLKPLADKFLGLPPEEQDAVKEWLLANYAPAKQKPSEWGRWICMAPGGIVGKYANGDVVRTEKLFHLFYKYVVDRDMEAAYIRERRLMFIMLRSERRGLRVDVAGLKTDLPVYEAALIKSDNWVSKRLGVKGLNLDSPDELADALVGAGFSGFLTTPTGKRSIGKESLASVIATDPQLLSVIGYRNRLMTCTNMFMSAWLAKGEATGRVYPSWHQVRNSRNSKDNNGARTGRIICTEPNLLNLSKDFEGRDDGYVHPKFLKVPTLPLVRKYMLPEEGEVWCHRDYNQQELRILAHYEDDILCADYKNNPMLDVHQFVKEQIKAIADMDVERREAKIINFGIIYGMGLGALSEKLKSDTAKAKSLKSAQSKAIPGLSNLDKELKRIGRSGEAIRTWGGREYYVEEPKLVNGRLQTYEYKLLNYLVQGSAADCTKEAIIRHDEARNAETFQVTVYDEVNISAKQSNVKGAMKRLRDVMASIEFDVPMLSDGKVGPNWGSLTKYEEK